MKRKDYEKPMMKIVELQYQSRLLQASGDPKKQLKIYQGEEWEE